MAKEQSSKKPLRKPAAKKKQATTKRLTPEQKRQEAEKLAKEKQEKNIELFNYACHEISLGSSVRSACEGLMDRKDFYEVIGLSEEYRHQYARACESRQEMIFEDIKDIADNANADLIIGPKGNLIVDGEAVQRSRVKIDARKWMLGKMNPKKYGDKLDVTSDGEKIAGTDLSKLTDDELLALSTALQKLNPEDGDQS